MRPQPRHHLRRGEAGHPPAAQQQQFRRGVEQPLQMRRRQTIERIQRPRGIHLLLMDAQAGTNLGTANQKVITRVAAKQRDAAAGIDPDIGLKSDPAQGRASISRTAASSDANIPFSESITGLAIKIEE